MAPRNAPQRAGMNTDELNRFVRMETQVSEMREDIRSIRECVEDLPAFLARLETNYSNLKEDVTDLQKRSDNRDWIAYVLSGIAALVGTVYGGK